MINNLNNQWESALILSHFNYTELNKQEIISLVKNVLNTKFNDSYKNDIHEHDDRINFACPYCGDSLKDSTKARGNLYLNTMQFHCYNCGKHSSFSRFIKTFLNISSYEINSIQQKDAITNKQQINILNSEFIDKYSIPKKDLLKVMNWVDIVDSKGEYYLHFRLIKDINKFAYDPKYNSIIILNTDNNNNVIGLQIRPINKKAKQPRFFTYNLSKLYDLIYSKTKLALLENEKKYVSAIDNISTVFNILQVNFNKPLTIFEGPFDALMFNNSIAMSGATKKLPISIEHVRYWYDNDNTGQQKAIEHLKNNEEVFLWSKYWDDLGQELQIKDLNELIIYSKKNNIKILNFEKYFSSDIINTFLI